jgi:enoyl-CoA hydratase
MTDENIFTKIKDGVALVTFNRPKTLNALNLETLDQLFHILAEIEKNENIRVIVLTGAGEKSFIAGADISELATFNSLQIKYMSQRGHEIIRKLENMPQPTIAAVNGFALGGGLEIALACDFIYASKTAKMGLPEITLGIIPGYGGTQRLPRLIGKNMAKELIYTGKMISADVAKEMGLVNNVCSPESLMDEVWATAKAISAKGRVSLRAAKQSINTGLNVDLNSGNQLEENAFALCFGSEDAKEGIRAFLEKREAVFKGTLK